MCTAHCNEYYTIKKQISTRKVCEMFYESIRIDYVEVHTKLTFLTSVFPGEDTTVP
jgi:hypothetical protein